MEHALEAKKAFTALAYSRLRSQPLYLEWAPVEVFGSSAATQVALEGVEHAESKSSVVDEPIEEKKALTHEEKRELRKSKKHRIQEQEQHETPDVKSEVEKEESHVTQSEEVEAKDDGRASDVEVYYSHRHS